MRVGIFTDLFYPLLIGGGENRYFEIAKQLVKEGDEIFVITSRIKGERDYDELFDGKLKIFRVGRFDNPRSGKSLLATASYALDAMVKLGVINKCDILDLNTYLSALAGKVASKLSGKPSIMTVHDVYWLGWLSEHNPLVGLSGLFIEMLLPIINFRGYFLTVSNSTRKKMVKLLRIDPERIFVVPNGVDYDFIRRAVEGVKKEEGSYRIIYVGRLIPYKKVDHILFAVKQLVTEGYNIKVDIVGEGGEKHRLINLAKKLGISDRVVFHGFVQDRSEVFRLIARAHLLVNPSIFEGFGMILLEAMACGTAVLAYRLPAYSEFARDGENAILVDYGIRNLIGAMRILLEDEKLRKKLELEGLKTARNFDWSQIAKRVKKVYETVIAMS